MKSILNQDKRDFKKGTRKRVAHGVGKLHILKRKGADSDEKNEECALAKKKRERACISNERGTETQTERQKRDS